MPDQNDLIGQDEGPMAAAIIDGDDGYDATQEAMQTEALTQRVAELEAEAEAEKRDPIMGRLGEEFYTLSMLNDMKGDPDAVEGLFRQSLQAIEGIIDVRLDRALVQGAIRSSRRLLDHITQEDTDAQVPDSE